MSIEVKCLQCGTTHHVNDRFAGRRVRCPQCETAVHVPELETPLVAPIIDGEAVEAEPVMVEAVVVEPVMVEAEVVGVEAVAMAATTVPAGTVNLASSAEPATAEEVDEDEDDQVLPRTHREAEELDMTPMVDVTFLLLIFFMVTAAFSLQKSIEMPRQQTDAPSTSVVEEEEEELDMVELEVDEFGAFNVRAMEWERETPGKQNLITALKDAMAGSDKGMRLKIMVHELAKLRALVDAMDAGTIAGYSELEVTQVEEFD